MEPRRFGRGRWWGKGEVSGGREESEESGELGCKMVDQVEAEEALEAEGPELLSRARVSFGEEIVGRRRRTERR